MSEQALDLTRSSTDCAAIETLCPIIGVLLKSF
jgi:hypothetical protein